MRPWRLLGLSVALIACAACGASSKVTTVGGTPSTSTTPSRQQAAPASTAVSTLPIPANGILPEPGNLQGILQPRFPSTFGGVVTTGEWSVDVYAVSDSTAIEAAARDFLGSKWQITVRPSRRSVNQALALEARIENDRGALAADGVQINGTGIRIEDGGPRVLAVFWPPTTEAKALMQDRYGADALLLLPSQGIVND